MSPKSKAGKRKATGLAVDGEAPSAKKAETAPKGEDAKAADKAGGGGGGDVSAPVSSWFVPTHEPVGLAVCETVEGMLPPLGLIIGGYATEESKACATCLGQLRCPGWLPKWCTPGCAEAEKRIKRIGVCGCAYHVGLYAKGAPPGGHPQGEVVGALVLGSNVIRGCLHNYVEFGTRDEWASFREAQREVIHHRSYSHQLGDDGWSNAWHTLVWRRAFAPEAERKTRAYFGADMLFQSALKVARYLGPKTAEVEWAKQYDRWRHVPREALPPAGAGREWIVINPINSNPADSYLQWGAPTWCTVDGTGALRLERMELQKDMKTWTRVEEVLGTINVFDAAKARAQATLAKADNVAKMSDD